MKAGVGAPDRAQISERTYRTDRWWAWPLSMGAVLAFFVVYATIRIFMNKYYWAGEEHYLTPIYSPCLPADRGHLVHHPGRVPRHLLLLPEDLLPVVLPVAGRVRGAGAARQVLG